MVDQGYYRSPAPGEIGGFFWTRGGLATAAQPPSTYLIGSTGYIGLPLKRDNLNEIRDIKNPNWTASPA